MEAVFLALLFMLSIFLGFELISKVPATLHTPLMSGANAISGITMVGCADSLPALGLEWLRHLGLALSGGGVRHHQRRGRLHGDQTACSACSRRKTIPREVSHEHLS